MCGEGVAGVCFGLSGGGEEEGGGRAGGGVCAWGGLGVGGWVGGWWWWWWGGAIRGAVYSAFTNTYDVTNAIFKVVIDLVHSRKVPFRRMRNAPS